MKRAGLMLMTLLLGLAAVLGGCDAAQPEETGLLVVEAFLQADAPLDTLVLRQTQPLAARGTQPAEGAHVRLTLGSQSVPYRASGVPGHYVPAGERVIARPHTPFALSVEWKDQQARADGTIPPPIHLDTVVVRVPAAPVRTVLVDSLRRDSLDVPAEQGYIYPIEVDLVWTSPPGDDAYWIQTRLRPYNPFSSRVIDFFLQPESVFREHTAERRTGRTRRWSGVYAVPADSTDAPLPLHRLRVGLVRSDSAYARFARTRNEPARREPDGNVRGALGIAAGVAVAQRTLKLGE